MQYKHAVLKTINSKLCVEVNDNEKPEFECSNHTFEGKMYQARVLDEWQQSCKYLDFASEEERDKIIIKQPFMNGDISSIITIKDDLVYFKGNEESQDDIIEEIITNSIFVSDWLLYHESTKENFINSVKRKFTITRK